MRVTPIGIIRSSHQQMAVLKAQNPILLDSRWP
jgi:hypothetical protein